MKKFGLFLIGGIAAIILLSNLGSIVGLAISLVILYLVFKQFLKADSTLMKIGWAILGMIILTAAASNVPAILGIVAAYILYLVYKKWNDTSEVKHYEKESDPFVNFEKQWSELNRN